MIDSNETKVRMARRINDSLTIKSANADILNVEFITSLDSNVVEAGLVTVRFDGTAGGELRAPTNISLTIDEMRVVADGFRNFISAIDDAGGYDSLTVQDEPVHQTRQDLINLFCNRLEHYSNGAVIVAGAAMVLHGLMQTTRDLDVTLPEELMVYHEGESGVKSGDSFIPVRFWPAGHDGIEFCTAGTEYISDPQNVVTIDGLRVLALPALLKFYTKLNRLKDQPKIRILKDALGVIETEN